MKEVRFILAVVVVVFSLGILTTQLAQNAFTDGARSTPVGMNQERVIAAAAIIVAVETSPEKAG